MDSLFKVPLYNSSHPKNRHALQSLVTPLQIKHISSEQLRVSQEGDYEIRLAPTAISKETGSHRDWRHMSRRALPYFESPLIWNCSNLESHYLFKSNTHSVPLPPRLSYRYLQRTHSSPSIQNGCACCCIHTSRNHCRPRISVLISCSPFTQE